MKKPMLTILLLLLPILLATTSESKESKNDFGIDLSAVYPGTEVAKILGDVAEEVDAAIEEAYAEGYKAGLLEEAPRTEYWKSRAEAAEKAESRQAKLLDEAAWKIPAASGLSFAAGVVLTLFVSAFAGYPRVAR